MQINETNDVVNDGSGIFISDHVAITAKHKDDIGEMVLVRIDNVELPKPVRPLKIVTCPDRDLALVIFPLGTSKTYSKVGRVPPYKGAGFLMEGCTRRRSGQSSTR